MKIGSAPALPHRLHRSLASFRARGATLVEALVAFVVLLLTVVAVVRVHGQFRLGSDIARQRSEAVRLAQQDVESLRAYSVIAASSGARSYAEIASASSTIDGAHGYATNTAYRLERDIRIEPAGDAKSASVAIEWTDRAGAEQRIVLASIVAAQDPVYAAALGVVPAAAIRGTYARSAFVPTMAKNLGGGRSAFKPIEGGAFAIVVDNASGLVVARCASISETLATRDLTSSDLAGCDNSAGMLVSGTVRFTLAAPPDPGDAHDSPPIVDVVLATTGGVYPHAPACSGETLKTVSYVSAGITRVESVPIAATPALLGLATWSDTGDRYVAYHCVVYPLASGRWSGRTSLVATGWSIGTGAADRRVCRYAADTDGSGAVDANTEHPANYVDVTAPLANQNFLVIAGTQACPVAHPVHIVGASDDVFADLSTVQHQP